MWDLKSLLITSPCLFVGLLILNRLIQSLTPMSTHHGIPRPPFLPYWIPFIGSAFAMGRGNVFWRKVNRLYGPVVRVKVMGETKTFITNPAIIHYIYKHSNSFDFLDIRKQWHSVVFGMSWKTSFASIWDDHLFAAHHRNMQIGSVASVIRQYADYLELELEQRLCESEGEAVDFVDFIFDIIFKISSKTIFTGSFPAASIKPDFLRFDAGFPILALPNLSKWIRRSSILQRDRMLDHLEKWYSTLSSDEKDKMAPNLKAYIEASEKEGWSDREMASLLLSTLWALEANAPYAAIWALLEILRRPDLVTVLRNEIVEAEESLSPPTLSSVLHLPQPTLVQKLPTLNACLQETLRFYSDSASIRTVLQDTILPSELCEGGVGEKHGLMLLKGEQVICVNRFSTFQWADSDTWDYERHMGDIKKGLLSPFGGGVSMCEGRHFASAEILTILVAFIMMVDVEIVQDGLKPATQRVGLGIQHPLGITTVRMTKRAMKE